MAFTITDKGTSIRIVNDAPGCELDICIQYSQWHSIEKDLPGNKVLVIKWGSISNQTINIPFADLTAPVAVDIDDAKDQIQAMVDLATRTAQQIIIDNLESIDMNTDTLEALLEQFKFIGDDLKTTLDGETVSVSLLDYRGETGVPSSVAQSGVSVPLLPTSLATVRKKFVIWNNSNRDLYINYGPTATVGSGIEVGPGDTWDDEIYTGDVSGIWTASGGGSAEITLITP